MKRNLLLTLTLCLATMGALAVERSQEQARQIALGTARQQGATQVSAYGSVAATRAKGTKQAQNQPYYIFNKENNKGFIIVSGDDRMPDVLGYTDKGAFDAANMPDAMKIMLEAYTKTLQGLQAGNNYTVNAVAELKTRTGGVTTTIGPLVKAEWDQGSPFNYYCPKRANGVTSLAGCEPVALAQIMHYYKWPKQTKAEIPALVTATRKYNLPAVPAGVAYDWDKMLDYYPGMGSLNAKKACGLLLLHAGQAMKADYNDTGYGDTGANIINVVKAMVDCFDYDPELLSFQSKGDYTLDAWRRLITNEIVASRPVFFEVYGLDASGYEAGHAVVIDGVDTEGRYHVNWGWGGSGNGWFDVDAMVNDRITWNIQPNVLVGITPNNNNSDEKPLASVLSLFRTDKKPALNVNGERADKDAEFEGKVRYIFANRSAKAFDGYVAMAVPTGNGTFKLITEAKKVDLAAPSGKTFATTAVTLSYKHAFNVGTTLIHGMMSYDAKNWIPVFSNDEYGIEVTATETKLTPKWNVQTGEFKTQDGKYELQVGKPTRFVFTLNNKGKVKWINEHQLRILWVNANNENSYGNVGYGNFWTGEIRPGASQDYAFTYTPTAVGTYYLYIYDNVTDEYYDTPEFTVSAVTAIGNANATQAAISGGEGHILVEGLAGQTVKVYSVDGRLFKQVLVKGNVERLEMQKGIYIVNGKKIIVK